MVLFSPHIASDLRKPIKITARWHIHRLNWPITYHKFTTVNGEKNKTIHNSPGWCGSVDRAQACEPKGRWFPSWAGHMPELWARSPVWGV